MRNKTKKEKDHIRECERFIMGKLNPAPVKERMFKTRIEIFTNTIDEILNVLMLAQEKYTTLHLSTDEERIEFDDKLYVVEKILGEQKDELGRTQYIVKWEGFDETTMEFRSALESTDKKGKWIVKPFKEYLNEKKKKK
jgi:hypothetical protein